MTSLIAIEAGDNRTISIFDHIIRAELLGVTEGIAVRALGHQAINDMTCISKALHVDLSTLWPNFTVLTTARLIRRMPGDAVGTLQVALRVHEELCWLSFLLDGDQEDRDVELAEGLLKIRVSDIRDSLEVLLSRQLAIDKITILGSLNKLSP